MANITQSGQPFSDSVNLGSNPSPPATANADVSGISRPPSASEKSEQSEQTAHTGRTETGTAPEWHDYADDLDDCCPVCGGSGVIEGDCTCMDDTCCCLVPEPPECPECGGRMVMTTGRFTAQSGRLTVERLGLDEANAFIAQHHRHHKPVVGHLFSLGAAREGAIVGVAIVGRPVARMRDDGVTAEVTRLCTDGTRNACSFLYGASARAAFALGFKRIGTYILASEPGTSLTAAGWRPLGERGGGSWSRDDRPRVDKHPTQGKLLFETCV